MSHSIWRNNPFAEKILRNNLFFRHLNRSKISHFPFFTFDMASLISNLHSIDEEILTHKNNRNVTTFTLNRPRKMNALSLPMLSRLSELFHHCENDSRAKLVILKANGKAFSAGGDIAFIAQLLHNGNVKAACEIFATAYSLMHLVAAKTTPQVSFLNGTTMGNGAGIAIHGSFRVATEKTVFAMPEAAIGGFPDVGSSYFLSRLPGFFGEYVGLTCARLDGYEMLALGLATHFVHSSKLASLEEALGRTLGALPCTISRDESHAYISAILDAYSEKPFLNAKSACNYMDVINKCFSKSTVEDILSSLEKELATTSDHDYHYEWLSSSIRSMKMASPTSLKIALKSIRGGRKLQGVRECIIREYRVACHILRGEMSKDFMEGCRALLLKDKKPKWEPRRLELVTDQMVSHYFTRLDDHEELKLPQTSKMCVPLVSKL